METISDALAASKHVHLVNNLVILLFILPASNAKGERAFSILEIIKSKGRAAMTQEVTSNLSIVKDNRDLIPDATVIIENFRRDSSKRINVYFKTN